MFRIRLRFFLLFILLSNGWLHAQNWQELNDSLSYYYERSDFNHAVPVARKIAAMAQKESGDSSESYGTALNNLAFLQQKIKDNKAAEKNYREAMTIRFNLHSPEHVDCLSVVQGLSNVLLAQGQTNEAVKNYSTYLKKLEESGKHQSEAGILARYRRAEIFLESEIPEKAKTDLMVITKAMNPMLADTILYYNTFNFLTRVFGDEKNIIIAEPYFLEHIRFCKWVDGEKSEEYVYALYRLAGLYSRGGRFDKAVPVMKQVLDGYKDLEGSLGTKYTAAVMNYATILLKVNQSKEADKTITELLESYKKEAGAESVAYEQIMYLAAMAYLQGGEKQKGENSLDKCIETCRKLGTPELLMARLLTLDSVYIDQDKKMERENILADILALQEKRQVLKDSVWALKISSLAGIYVDKGDYANASMLAEKYDSLTQQCFKGDNEEYLQSRRVAGYFFSLTERMDKAERYYQEALRVAKKIWKENNVEYAKLLRNVGTMYYNSGLYKKSTELLKSAAAIFEQSDSTVYDQLADIYHKLAGSYDLRSEKTQDEYYLIKAVEVGKKIADGNKIRAILSNNLANHFESTKQYSRADSMYEDTRTYTNLPGQPIYNQYLIAGVQQAVNAVNWGFPQKGEATIKQTLRESTSFYKDSNVIDSRFMLFICEYYRITQQYPMAVEWGKKMLTQAKRKMGEDNPGIVSTLVILSRLFFESGNFKEAEEVISLMNRISLTSMLKNFEVLSDSEKEKYIANKVSTQHLSNSLLLREKNVSAEFIKETFNQTLLLKSLILSENRRITAAVLNSSDTVLKRLYRDWLSVRQMLSKEYAKPKQLRQAGLEATEERADQIQKEITGRSSGLLKQQETTRVSLSTLQQSLSADEAIIEFVHFAVFRKSADSAMYAAYVLRRNQQPVFVPLCERMQLQKLFDSAGSTATSMVNRFYRGTEIRNNTNATALGSQLYKLIWAPLEPYLKGVKKISYSPAGKLYNIAFHAIPVDSSRLLMDIYILQQYTSTRQVALSKTEAENKKVRSIALFGDPSFSLDSNAMVKLKRPGQTASDLYTPQDRGTRGGSWIDLPGTAMEVEKVKQLFEKQELSASLFTKTMASEENLKSLSGHSPQVLHIATHGFFLSEPKKEENQGTLNNKDTYTLAEDPLLRSGLILAGGNRAWSGKTPIEGMEDGIATAYEISQLNLSNTELVVLSACETALGDVKGNEGVFGLQRAFKMAGVKKMIVSLWQVPDNETAELMTAFYSYWLKGKTINEAFAQAQTEMRKKYSPYYWAAFVLVE